MSTATRPPVDAFGRAAPRSGHRPALPTSSRQPALAVAPAAATGAVHADILGHRLARLQGAFATERCPTWDCAGGYSAVYPIKVNQQHPSPDGTGTRSAAPASASKARFQPRTPMAVIALAHPGSIVICSGYKEPRYHPLRFLSRAQARPARVFIVDQPSELAPALEKRSALGVGAADLSCACANQRCRRRQVAEHRR